MIVRFHSEFGEEIKNEQDRKWYKKHQEELKWAKENNSCPSCGKKLKEDDVLYDYGFKCGLACGDCR